MTYLEGAAKFYDYFGEKEDASFYVELAKKHGYKALELGVGTARLAIQLARAGIVTWGIDNSPYMIRVAESKVAQESPEVRERLHLKLADAIEFTLDTCFGLIYFPSSSFDHILEKKDQIKALGNIRNHLQTGGVFAFDLAHIPNPREEGRWFVQKKLISQDRSVVRIGYHKMSEDKQFMTLNLWYELFEHGKMMERYFEDGKVYIHTPEGIRKLLKQTGFEIEAWYGGYEKQPFNSESNMMVIVAKCPQNISIH